MKRLIIAALIVLLATLLLSNITDTSPSIADTNIPDNELTSNVTETDNLSDNATITITWRTAPHD